MVKLLKISLVLVVLLLAGCGGGGGGSTMSSNNSNNNANNSNPTQATHAVLKISTAGTLASGTSLSGIGVTLRLPAGVTVDSDANGNVQTDVVAGSGVAVPGTIANPIYTPATSSTQAILTFVIASNNQNGFTTGEFATVTCKVSSETTPQQSDFSITSFSPANLNLAPVTGLTPSFTLVLQ